MPFDADDFGGMENKAMAISSAVCSRNGGCATGTLMNDDVRASHGCDRLDAYGNDDHVADGVTTAVATQSLGETFARTWRDVGGGGATGGAAAEGVGVGRIG